MGTNSTLVAIDAGLFCVGMYVKSGIFYRYKDAYVLLCKNVRLNNELLDHIQMIASTQGGVYVEEDEFPQPNIKTKKQGKSKVIDYNHEFYDKLIKVKSVYNKVANDTMSFLDESQQDCSKSLWRAANIANDINNTLNNMDKEMVFLCINEVRQVDDHLYNHCINVAMLNGLMAEWLGMPKEDKHILIKVGLLHDIGKLKIPSDILYKPGKLTKEEFDIIRNHPIYSFQMLKEWGETDFRVLQGVRSHHEKMNGMGYPDGLTADKIPLFSRITTVSDIYDAMVSRRCYKSACSPFDVLDQFHLNKFSNLDTRVVNSFLDVVPYLLVGNEVVLSTGEEGVVVYVRPENYAYPIVRVKDKLIVTNSECRCIVMCTPYSQINKTQLL